MIQDPHNSPISATSMAKREHSDPPPYPGFQEYHTAALQSFPVPQSHQYYHSEGSSLPPREGISPSQLPQRDAEDLSALLRWMPSPPTQASPCLRLPQPVAIPQIEPPTLISGPMPFMRAYAPILHHFNIDPIHFLAFLDNLTIAMAPSPPVQAIQLVGTGIGFVPHHWAQLASGGIGLAASAGGAASSMARTKKFLQQTNETFFEPRGLRVKISSDEELRHLLAQQPQSDLNNSDIPLLAPVNVSSGCTSLAERRLATLGNSVAQLRFDGLPLPSTEGKNMIDKLSGKQVDMKIRKNKEKAIKKAEKRDKPGKKDKKSRKSDEDDLKRVKKLKWIVIESLVADERLTQGSTSFADVHP